MEMFCHDIMRSLAGKIHRHHIYAVLIDDTQDITGTEQESICIRYVDDDLNVHEDFIGLYNVPDTTGNTISRMLFDVLTRLNLPLTGLRAQTYDGAATMSGAYKGCQARVKPQQPLALHFHCGAHRTNLVMQNAVNACACVWDAIQCVHELGVMLHKSGKLKVSHI